MSQYLGDVSAYAYAVSKGYTGTEDEFAQLMADYAAVGERAEEAATEAAGSATAAAESATTATEAATTASGAATTAVQSATAAGTSATAAQTAQTAAETAETNAAGSATAADASADRAEEIAHEITADWDSKADVITETASGDIVTFSDGADDMIMRSLVVNIDPVQSGSGDPSPDNIRPISGWTEVNVTRAGKNLLPPHAVGTVTSNGITWTVNADGTVTANGTATANATLYIPDNVLNIPVLAPLILTGCPTGGGSSTYRIFVYKYLNGVNTGVNVSDTGNGVTVTPDDTFNQIRIALRVSNDATVNNLVFRPMLRAASITDATYESYAGETYPATLPTTVYGGTLDIVTGKLIVDRALTQLTSASMYDSSGKALNLGILPQSAAEVSTLKTADYAASIMKPVVSIAAVRDDANDNVFTVLGRTVWGKSSTWASVADANAFLSTNPMQIVYKLATPLEYDLTTQEVTTLLGYNTIYADCGGIASAEYPADTKKYIDNLITAMQSNIAYIEGGTTASRAYTVGQYVIVGGTLYKVTASIASGATFTPGTNIVSTTVGAELTALQ